MAKTEKNGKARLRFAPKFLENKGEYLVKKGKLIRVFPTQTKAFAYAMPKGLTVYKKEGWSLKIVSLCPMVEGKMKKEELKAKKEEVYDGRWNSEWMRR